MRAGLLGLTQGVSLHDPLRLHHALHSQATESMKDGSSTTSLLRPLTDYPHLPLLPFTAPPFLHPHLDPRLPFSPSAFHPLHHPAHEAHARAQDAHTKLPPPPTSSLSGSAFSPLPAKTPKMEEGGCSTSAIPCTSSGLFSPALLASLDPRTAFLTGGGGGSGGGGGGLGVLEDRRDSPSPRGSHGSRESPGHARDTDTPNSNSDEPKGRKPRPGESWCPVCGVTLRPGELESHFSLELEKLARLPQSRPLSQRTPTPTTSTTPTTTTPTPSSSTVTSVAASSPLSPHLPHHARVRDPGWDTYQRVRANRQMRLRAKKRRSGRGDECGPACPVCGERVSAATAEDLHSHVESCLRRCGELMRCGVLQGGSAEEEVVVDVEGDGPPYEEYEWCGQRRVRVSSMLRPPSQLPDRHRDGPGDRNGDTEMGNASGGGGGGGGGGGAGVLESSEGGNGGSRVEPMSVELEALKEKVRVLERDGAQPSKFLCLVCQTEYDRPAVSVVCWHVMCEACWGHSLGIKTECPQCSQSVSAEDLRPIHL